MKVHEQRRTPVMAFAVGGEGEAHGLGPVRSRDHEQRASSRKPPHVVAVFLVAAAEEMRHEGRRVDGDVLSRGRIEFIEAVLRGKVPVVERIATLESLPVNALEEALRRPLAGAVIEPAARLSFVVMEEHNVKEALTADHHFEQAGFISLLKTE